MNAYSINDNNVRVLSAIYRLDSDVEVVSYNDLTIEGLKLNFINALDGCEDITYNKYNLFYLTPNIPLSKCFTLKLSAEGYPYYMTTYLKLSGMYLKMDSLTSASIYNLNTSLSDTTLSSNEQYFELEFLNQTDLKVRKYHYGTMRYLALYNSEFQFLTSGLGDTFKYVVEDQRLSLFLNSKILYNDLLTKKLSSQSFSYTSDEPYSGLNVFEIRHYPRFNKNTIETQWSVYENTDTKENFDLSLIKTLSSLDNNFIIYSTYGDVSSNTFNVNLFSLKNQLTIENSQSRNNPFNVLENNVLHRIYRKLHTGTYQDGGNDSIYLSYINNIKEVLFESGKTTYFHSPYNLYPFTQVNVNSSTLVDCGCIYADSPIKADKIFKKKVNVFNTTNILDEQDGMWLCAWLSGGYGCQNPIWVDRYYNPRYITFGSALSSTIFSGGQVGSYFDEVIGTLNAQNFVLFDKKSDLVFEPGALYAYSRIGQTDLNKQISAMSGTLLFDGIEKFQNYKYSRRAPTDNGTYKTYKFNNDNYGFGKSITRNGSFSMVFDLQVEDWQNPFSFQIVGNYINQGFGVFNEEFITPFIVIPGSNGGDTTTIHIYNSDLVELSKYTIQPGTVVKQPHSENYFVNGSNVYEYTMNNGQINTTNNRIIGITNLSAGFMTDTDVDENNLYSVYLSGVSAFFTTYNFSNNTISNTYVGPFNLNDNPRIHAVGNTVHVLSGNGFGGMCDSVVDLSGNGWFIKNNRLYKQDNNTIFTACTAVNGINAVNCDRYNNIWMIHDSNKVSKMSSDRKTVYFTKEEVFSTISVPYYIDFICELTSEGYKESVLLLANNNAVKMDLDGNVLLTKSILDGETLQKVKSATGYNILRNKGNTLKNKIYTNIGLSNLYKSRGGKYEVLKLRNEIDISNYRRGERHHFSIIFNDIEGKFELYVDAKLKDVKYFEKNKYHFESVLIPNVVFGTSSYYNNLTLPIYLQQPTYYLSKMNLSDIKFYDHALNYFDLRSHAWRFEEINTIKFDLPVGQRNYIESIDRFFKFELPGRKAHQFNLVLNNTSLTDTNLKVAVEDKIKNQIKNLQPFHNQLKDIRWSN